MINKAYLENLRRRISGLETEMSAPGVAANPQKMQALMHDYAHQKRVATAAEYFLKLEETAVESRAMLADESTDAELREMAQAELADVEAKLPEAEKAVKIALLPPDPSDSKNVIMEIRAGTGGDEAAIFAGDLYRMYSRYAESNGLKISVMDVSPSESGGYKEIVFSVEGEMVYKKLRYESGTHRVQRVPATETQGRIHTSAATVAVLAEAEEVDIEIRNEDLRIDTYRSSGSGGQHVNTTDSAVRIVHIPSGIIVQCQAERSQHKNRDKAMKMLRAKIYEYELDKKKQAAEQFYGAKGEIAWGHQIRSYVLQPYTMVKDHRTDTQSGNTQSVLDGNIGDFIEAYLKKSKGRD